MTETTIKINQIGTMIVDTIALDRKYNFYSISTSELHFQRGARMLDSELLNNNILSIYWLSGKTFYIQGRKTLESESIRTILDGEESSKNLTFKQMHASEFMSSNNMKRVLLQLLFNSLINEDRAEYIFNNLTGHLYLHAPSDVKTSKDMVTQVNAVELSIDGNLAIQISSQVFSNTKLCRYMEFGKKKFSEYEKYTFAYHTGLKRIFSNEGETFIKKQLKGETRSTIPFINFGSLTEFNSSKMGILEMCMELFNSQYPEVRISFREIPEDLSLNHKASENNKYISRLIDIVGKHRITLIDKVHDQEGKSKEYMNQIRTLLSEKPFFLDAVEMKNHCADDYTFSVIQPADYYKEHKEKDPHDMDIGKVIQHVTLRKEKYLNTSTMKCLLKELVIKDDIRNKRLSLVDWPVSGITDDIEFFTREEYEDKNKNIVSQYPSITIHTDGTFDFFLYKSSDPNIMKINTLYEEEDFKPSYSRDIIEGVIRYKGNINSIRKTNFYTIPEISEIKKVLTDKASKGYGITIKNKDARNELLYSCMDIRYFTNGTDHYYIAGPIGADIRFEKFQRASIIRKIIPFRDSELFAEEIMPMLNIVFVRNMQLTVIPFPFKYLREVLETTCSVNCQLS